MVIPKKRRLPMPVKPVKFNENNPVEKEMLDHLKKYSNYSGYIKNLIRTDIARKKQAKRSERGKNIVYRSNETGVIKFEL
jgi:hypothetical protein